MNLYFSKEWGVKGPVALWLFSFIHPVLDIHGMMIIGQEGEIDGYILRF